MAFAWLSIVNCFMHLFKGTMQSVQRPPSLAASPASWSQHSLQACRGSPCSTPLCTFNATRLFNIIAGRESEFHQIPISLVLMTNEVEPIVICLFNLLVISLIVSSLEHLNSSWTLCLQCCGSCLNCMPAPSVFRYLPVSMLRKFCFLLRFKMYLKLLVCNAPDSSRLCLSDH